MSDTLPNFQDVVLPSAQNRNNNNNNNRPENQTPNQVWVNVGVWMESKTVPGKKVFISLPLGIAADAMKEPKIPALKEGNEDQHYEAVARAKLYEMFKAKMAAVPPGGEVVLNLQVQGRRIKQEVKVNEVESPFGDFKM